MTLNIAPEQAIRYLSLAEVLALTVATDDARRSAGYPMSEDAHDAPTVRPAANCERPTVRVDAA